MGIDMSARLVELRKKTGYSQEKVSEVLGVTRQAISKWENGQGLPEANNLLELSRLYHVSVDYLLTGELNEPEAASPTTGAEKTTTSATKRLLIFLLGFAGVSIIGAMFLFLLTFLLRSF